jgi:hypothetical protein
MLWILILICSFALGISVSSQVSKKHALAAAFPIGLFLSTWMCFAFSYFFGFTYITIGASLAVSLALFLLIRPQVDFAEISKLEYGLVIASILIFFVLNSSASLTFNKEGSAQTSDWDFEYHASLVSYFASGAKVDLVYPFIPSEPLRYYFLIDFTSAELVRFGASLVESILIVNVLLSACLVLALYRLGLILTKSRLAAVLAVILVLFASNLGFVYFFETYNSASISEKQDLASNFLSYPFVRNLEKGIAIMPAFMEYFLIQRPALAGLSIAVCLLIFIFESKPDPKRFALLGILAGFLPLYNLHAFAFVAGAAALLCLFDLKNLKAYAVFGVIALLIAAPQLLFLSGSNAQPKFEPGWVLKNDAKEWQIPDQVGPFAFAWFWIGNGGILLLLGCIGLYYSGDKIRKLAIFALLIFILLNVVILHPYKQDNRKLFLLVSLIMSFPAALVLERLLSRNILWPIFAVALLLLTAGSILEYASIVAGHGTTIMYPASDLQLCDRVANLTSRDALFLDSGVYCISSLAGRKTFIRLDNTGEYWLESRKMDYSETKDEYLRMLQGDIGQIYKNNISYVILGTGSLYSVNRERLTQSFNVLWTDNSSYILEVNKTGAS